MLPGWNCATCTQQWERGCEKDSPVTSFTLLGETTKRCPLRPFLDDPNVPRALWFYHFYTKGMMPEPGTFLDQPVVWLRLMTIIDEAVHESEKDQRAEEAAKAKKASRSAAKGGGEKMPPMPRPLGPRTV